MINTKRDANIVILSLEFKLESILDGENKVFLNFKNYKFWKKKKPKNSTSQTLYVINSHK